MSTGVVNYGQNLISVVCEGPFFWKINNSYCTFQRTDLFTSDDIGQRKWMTDNDALKIRKMYNCSEEGKYFLNFTCSHCPKMNMNEKTSKFQNNFSELLGPCTMLKKILKNFWEIIQFVRIKNHTEGPRCLKKILGYDNIYLSFWYFIEYGCFTAGSMLTFLKDWDSGLLNWF